jgi:selenocysteine-specific elongation factor
LKQIILGTAGHIDHGKTSFIKALTGIDTDRLKEEKRRGITIELGFAAFDLPDGQHIGIVDVPGHEKFIKNMVAGAGGIDIVAMIIASDEGVMPQTREHLDICSLLGIQHGIVVLTKIDMVDDEWLDLVKEEVQEFTQNTFLENAPVVPISSVTGEGLTALIETLQHQCADLVPSRTPGGLFRLPVDRVFSMKGFGTVITGTLISGNIRTGETIEVYPSRITAKIRGIQVHNHTVEEAVAGMRTAINFQGLEKESVRRGDILARPETLKPSYMVDAHMKYLPGNRKPLKNRIRIRFHSGTSETMGNLILLDRDELFPGESALVQIRLDTLVTVVKDDRFVIRSYSPVRTISGGRILNPISPKHKRFDAETLEGLENILQENVQAMLSFQIQQAGYQGLSFAELLISSHLPEKQLNNELQTLLSQTTIIQFDKKTRSFLHQHIFDKLTEIIQTELARYHENNPLKKTMSREELKSKLPAGVDPRLFNIILTRLVKLEQIVQEENTVRLTRHQVALQLDEETAKQKILDIYRNAGLKSPTFGELIKIVEMDESTLRDVLQLLIEEQRLVKIKKDLYFHTTCLQDLQSRLMDFLIKNHEISTPQFKEMTGVSRKYTIPLIEFFDSQKITIRVGDNRRLRSRSTSH